MSRRARQRQALLRRNRRARPHRPSKTTRPSHPSAVALGLTALLLGCMDLLQDPASPPPAVLALTVTTPPDPSLGTSQRSAAASADAPDARLRARGGSTAVADGASDAVTEVAPANAQRALEVLFDDVDEVRVQILREDDVVRDTTVQLEAPEEDTRIRIRLDLADNSETVSVRVELLVEGLPALRGDAQVSVEAGATAEVQIEPEPIVGNVSVPDSVLELEDIGESAQLAGRVLSVTGDPIPDLALTWETLDPEVVEVTTDGLVTALASGEARGRYWFDDLFRGDYVVRASTANHVTQSVEVLLQLGEDAKVNFRLRPIIIEDRPPRNDP